MFAAHANDVQNKNETQCGNATELDIVDTKNSSTDLHNKMELNFESEAMWGLKNKMVFDSPKVLA